MNINGDYECPDAKCRDFIGDLLVPEKVEKVANADSPAPEEKSAGFLKAACCWVLSRS